MFDSEVQVPIDCVETCAPSQPTKVRQRLRTDCGVACLAMVARVEYEQAAQAFTQAGLAVKRRGKQPFSSNFKDIASAAARLDISIQMQRFRSWDDVQSPTILKVSSGGGRKGDWHWVVALRTERGIEILDPGTDLPSFENPPDDTAYIDFTSYQPTGNILVRYR